MKPPLAAPAGASAPRAEPRRSPEADRGGEVFTPEDLGVLAGQAGPRYAALPPPGAGELEPVSPPVERLQPAPSPAAPVERLQPAPSPAAPVERLQPAPSPAGEPKLDRDAPAVPRELGPGLAPLWRARRAAAPRAEPAAQRMESARRVPGPEGDVEVRPTAVEPRLGRAGGGALAVARTERDVPLVANAEAGRSRAALAEWRAPAPDAWRQTPAGETTRPAHAASGRGPEPPVARARSAEGAVSAGSAPHESVAAASARPAAAERLRHPTRDAPPAMLDVARREAAALHREPTRAFARMAAPPDAPALEPRDGGTPRPALSQAGEGTLPPIGADARAAEPRVEAPREALPNAQSLQALTQRVEWLATRGGGTARVHLDPPHLGEVELQIRAVGSEIRVSMIAEEAGARVLLEAGREWLVDQFASRDLRVSHFEVHDRSAAGGHGDALASRGNEGGDTRNDGAGREGRRSGPNAPPTSPESAPVATRAADPTVRRVDLRI